MLAFIKLSSFICYLVTELLPLAVKLLEPFVTTNNINDAFSMEFLIF